VDFSVLYLIDTLERLGGAEKHLFNLAHAMAQRGVRFIICTLAEGGVLVGRMRSHGLRVEEVAIKRVYSPLELRPILRLAEIIRKEKVQIIHTYHFASDFLGTLLGIVLSVPVVISSRRDMGFKKKRLHKLAYRIINPFTTKIIVVSRAVQDIVKKEENVAASKIATIYNGVNLKNFCPHRGDPDQLKQRFALPLACPLVGMIANLHRVKGHLYFLKAARIVHQRMTHVHFLIVGDGELRLQLETFCHKVGLEKRVHFLGVRRDIRTLLSIMDISVLCSLTEGFSNTILESMAMQTPVIATAVGGNVEIIDDGVTGLLVPPKNESELARAIMVLLSSRHFATSIANAAYQNVKKNFSEENMVEQTASMYTSLLLKNRKYGKTA